MAWGYYEEFIGQVHLWLLKCLITLTTSLFSEPSENLKEILAVIVSQSSVSKSKKLAYLNALVKLVLKYGNDKYSGLSKRDILCW